MQQLVLASTSPYRRQLLERLQIPFETCAPQVDETPQPGESAVDLVSRLSIAKAMAVAAQFPDAVIIGSDQTALLEGNKLGKPCNHENAILQLRAASGKTVRFLTGLCVFNARTRHQQIDVVPFDVVFRELTEHQIETYLRREQPYDCAGSFKSEGLGIALFEQMNGTDPSALIGLPLIRLVQMLEQEGLGPLV